MKVPFCLIVVLLLLFITPKNHHGQWINIWAKTITHVTCSLDPYSKFQSFSNCKGFSLKIIALVIAQCYQNNSQTLESESWKSRGKTAPTISKNWHHWSSLQYFFQWCELDCAISTAMVNHCHQELAVAESATSWSPKLVSIQHYGLNATNPSPLQDVIHRHGAPPRPPRPLPRALPRPPCGLSVLALALGLDEALAFGRTGKLGRGRFLSGSIPISIRKFFVPDSISSSDSEHLLQKDLSKWSFQKLWGTTS